MKEFMFKVTKNFSEFWKNIQNISEIIQIRQPET